jgi:hypothetical protein
LKLDAILRSDPTVLFGSTPCDASRALAVRGMPVVQCSAETAPALLPGPTKSVTEVLLADSLDTPNIDDSDRTLFDWIRKALARVSGESVPVVFARFRESRRETPLPLLMRDMKGVHSPWTPLLRGGDPAARLGRRTLQDATLVVNAENGVLLRARMLAARAMAAPDADGRVRAIAAIAALVARLAHLENVGALASDANDALLALVAEAPHAG